MGPQYIFIYTDTEETPEFHTELQNEDQKFNLAVDKILYFRKRCYVQLYFKLNIQFNLKRNLQQTLLHYLTKTSKDISYFQPFDAFLDGLTEYLYGTRWR